MSKNKKFYKVVSKDLGSSNTCNDKFRIQYVINKWIKPKLKHSKLFVFCDLRTARCYRIGEERIFECEVKDPARIKYACYTEKAFEKFWKSVKQHKKRPCSTIIYPGTYTTSKVKLIREIL